MNKKLLIICGPTATGKTSLALHLAKVLGGELISVDSRQIYKGMDIGTGKDIPEGFEFRVPDLEFKRTKIGYYTNGSTRLWGYDLVGPNEEFSVAHYIKIASEVIEDTWEREKFPILVGGTGLYIKGLVDGINTAQVPKNEDLRDLLENKSVSDLQNMLKKVDPKKLKSLNESDLKNPRRLIRAIEVVKYKSQKVDADKNTIMNDGLRLRINKVNRRNLLTIGLMAPRRFLNERIEKRVNKRLKQGIEGEIDKLLKSGVGWDSQAMQALGYRQWKEYFERFGYKNRSTKGAEFTENTKAVERQKAIKKWKVAEKQYAKRQITWFKKDKRIRWFDISEKGYLKGVENLVCKWYYGLSSKYEIRNSKQIQNPNELSLA